MKVKNKKTGTIGQSSTFNTHALDEIIVYTDDCTSDFISDYDVFIESIGEWVDMHEAFGKKLIITDNYNTEFREPLNKKEKERGWY